MIDRIVQREIEAIRRDIIMDYERKGMRASGNLPTTLEIETESTRNRTVSTLYGAAYIEYLERGVEPFDLVEGSAKERGVIAFLARGPIAEWKRQKRVSIPAFAIATKIVRQGWKRENFGGVNLISDVITPQRVQEILDRIGQQHAQDFIQGVLKILPDANN